MGLIKKLFNKLFKKNKENEIVSKENVENNQVVETEETQQTSTKKEPLTLQKSNKLILRKINQKRKSLRKSIENAENYNELLDERLTDEENNKISKLFKSEKDRQSAKIEDYNNQLAISDVDAYQGIVDKATLVKLDSFIAIAKDMKKTIKKNTNPIVKKFVGRMNISVVSNENVQHNIRKLLLQADEENYEEIADQITGEKEEDPKQISIFND